MTTNTFTTTVLYHNSVGGEVEQDVAVTYTYHKGWDGGRYADSPPEPDGVEIQSVVPDVPDACYADLVEQCFEDHANYLADAAEWKADMRRDDYV